MLGDFPEIDYRRPDFNAIFQWRIAFIRKVRANPASVAPLKLFFRDNPIEFIRVFGTTYDPRNVSRGLPAVIPFVPFPRQVEFMEWLLEKWRNGEAGVAPKSRDVGASYCAIALSLTMALHYSNFRVGFGSRKQEYVDKSGDPKSLFWKGRSFLDLIPTEFRGGFDSNNREHAPHMRITIPETESMISGEAGDNIGRGDRTSLYFVDESAHLERPLLADAALSATTDCRIDMSSVNGTDNPFAEKVQKYPDSRKFIFHWRDDPRKDDEWYRKKCEEIDNPAIVAQELDIDFSASVEYQLIPSTWIEASIDAAKRLGLTVTGDKIGALDVADEGKDKNAFASRHGVELQFLESWSGVGGTIFKTTARTFNICDALGLTGFRYDADGLGVGVRGDAEVLNESRAARPIMATAFRGSGEVVDADKQVFNSRGQPNGRTNADYFANRKAQGWWNLRMRFERTYKWIVEGQACNPDEIISLASSLPELGKLKMELGQPTYTSNGAGKMLVNKVPDGAKSPNLADAVMIAFAPEHIRRGFL